MDAIKTYEKLVLAITESLLDEAFQFKQGAVRGIRIGATAKEDPVAAFHALFAK